MSENVNHPNHYFADSGIEVMMLLKHGILISVEVMQ